MVRVTGAEKPHPFGVFKISFPNESGLLPTGIAKSARGPTPGNQGCAFRANYQEWSFNWPDAKIGATEDMPGLGDAANSVTI